MADGETLARASLEEARSWRGHSLDDVSGAGVGRIEGVFVDTGTGEAEWLLARMGRFGHHTLVPARDAVEGVRRVWVPFTREAIRRAPKVDPVASLTAAEERALLEHYGIAGASGRAPELVDRDPGAVSLTPAEHFQAAPG